MNLKQSIRWYKKDHKDLDAAKSHKKNIEDRGGIAFLFYDNGIHTVKYHFERDKMPKKFKNYKQ